MHSLNKFPWESIINYIFAIYIKVPSAPPDSVQTGMLNLTAGWVKWLPPPPQHHNGVLLGYKIQVDQFIVYSQ